MIKKEDLVLAIRELEAINDGDAKTSQKYIECMKTIYTYMDENSVKDFHELAKIIVFG